MENNRRRPERREGHNANAVAVEKANDFSGTLKKLFKYLRPYYFKLFLVVLFASFSTIFTIVGPKVLSLATDRLSEGIMDKIRNNGVIDFDYILYIILILLGLYIVSAILRYIQGYISTGISQDVSFDLRTAISKKVDRVPLNYFDNHASGDTLSIVSNDIDTISQTLSQSLSQVITAAVTVVGIIIMMLTISVSMTFVGILVLPISMFLISTVMRYSQKYYNQQQESLGDVNGHIEEMYGGHLIVKAFNGEDKSVEQFEKYNDELYNSAWKSQFLSGLMQPLANFAGNIGYVGIVLIGGMLAVQGTISIGDIQAFIQYVQQFNQPVSQLAQTMNMLQQTAAAAERVFEFLEVDELTPDSDSKVIDSDKVTGAVMFDSVEFGYTQDKPVINNFSLYVKPGQTVAIVGPTGAGKTTIVKLLMRFYELNSGNIYLDNFDISKITRKSLRENFSMVLQDTWLFNGTIKENLIYGNIEASESDILKAAKVANVDHFINTLENGYDTVINEDSSNISQGEKQLLTIARAFLKDPKILILDEATSSVDTRTELLIQKGMENLMKDRTSFVIAHRLSTIKDADIIIVMDQGDIVEVGDHNSLLQAKGFYAEMYESQFAV